jgi:hypothetical protein
MPAVAFDIYFEHYFGYRNGGMAFVVAFIMVKEMVK